MADIPGPYELLELEPGASLSVHPTSWEHGQMVINPRDGRPPKLINVLRLHVPLEEKGHLPSYWDITSQTLIPSLVGLLPAAIARHQMVRITKVGEGVKARFTLQVV